MPEKELQDLLLTGAGALISLGVTYIPWISTWYEKRQPTEKAGIMAGVLLLASLLAFGGACAGFGELVGLQLTCDQAGAVSVGAAFVKLLLGNQAAYLLVASPRAKSSAGQPAVRTMARTRTRG